METGNIAYVRCHGSAGQVPVTGWIIALEGDEAILATTPSGVKEVPNQATAQGHGLNVAFIRVPSASLALTKPEEWQGPKLSEIPGFVTAQVAWKSVDSEGLSSSGAEKAGLTKPRNTRVEQEIKNLGKLFQRPRGSEGLSDVDSEDEEDDSEVAAAEFLRPGAFNKMGKKKNGSKAKHTVKDEEINVKQLVLQGLAAGQTTTDMMPLLMVALLQLQDQKTGKKKKDKARGSSSSELLGGSSSESSEGEEGGKGHGMKAMATLHRLHDQVRKHPRRVCEIFEKEARDEMGVVAGQSWTLRDYMKRHPWGKFKGIYRCAIQDVAAYELIRAGKHDEAGAQLVQNMKSKLQSVLQGGSWETAWLLTGLADPMQKREFAGTREEMAVVSGYLDALHKLKKRVKEAQGSSQADDEDEAAAASRK
ncbi:unnamed protein product [Symbiodinium natans]|uniref:Uncharacterized protein n=1 Tax=Symbiodinium natans TaxID=878477 RepID=A0A812U505_9DINO|nr:unnamed protein product [Symbiodinium natans]